MGSNWGGSTKSGKTGKTLNTLLGRKPQSTGWWGTLQSGASSLYSELTTPKKSLLGKFWGLCTAVGGRTKKSPWQQTTDVVGSWFGALTSTAGSISSAAISYLAQPSQNAPHQPTQPYLHPPTMYGATFPPQSHASHVAPRTGYPSQPPHIVYSNQSGFHGQPSYAIGR